MHSTLLPVFLLGLGLLLPPFTLWRRGRPRARLGKRLTLVLALLPCLPLVVFLAPRGTKHSGASVLAPHYTITDLGFLPGGSLSEASDINDRGQVVGSSNAADGKRHPFFYANAKMKDLGVPMDAFGGEAKRINKKGVISVNYVYKESGGMKYRAFRSCGSKMEALPLLSGTYASQARGVDDAGQIVGLCTFADSKVCSVLWKSNGDVTRVSGLGEGFNGAYDMNNKGVVVGYAGGGTKSGPHGYIADSRGVEMLGDLGGGASRAESINVKSEIAGSSHLADGLQHAFLYQSGRMHDLGTLYGHPGEYSQANTISESGDVLGDDLKPTSFDKYNRHAFLWRGIRMIDLNACINTTEWQILDAAAENNKGQIAATALKGGKFHAILLTPQ